MKCREIPALVKVAHRLGPCWDRDMNALIAWIHELTWEHLLLALNSIAVVLNAWTALLATRRADRWQAVAQGVVRRERDPSTARTRVWLRTPAPMKRDTPGQRLSRFVER